LRGREETRPPPHERCTECGAEFQAEDLTVYPEPDSADGKETPRWKHGGGIASNPCLEAMDRRIAALERRR
jgi:hypothetical protein